MRNLILAGLLFSSANAFAIGGADVLLNNVGSDDESAAKAVKINDRTAQGTVFEGFKLNDPVMVQMFTEWRTAGKLDYEVNGWFMKLLQGKYEQAAHLLSVMNDKMPSELYTHMRVSEVYLYHKLGLNQRFFDTWVELLKDKKAVESRIGMTLWQYVDQVSPGFFAKNSIHITDDQAETIANVENANTPFFVYANATMSLRKGKNAYQSLISLPSGHPYKIPLAQTVILDMARNNELGNAGKVLKKYLEPEIEKVSDPYILGEYYLNLARFLYQAGAMDAAESYYLKVPNKHEKFTQARAELMWSYLRTGKTAELRGQLASLKTELFSDFFIPEIYVVRSISNLKLCQYAEVEKDFQNFITANKKWARIIRAKMTEESPKWSEHKDFFLKLADQRVAAIEKEMQQITELGKRSIKAALPAVGVQPHWSKNNKEMAFHLQEAKKQRIIEYKRPWINRERILAEAIKKMKFVKIETMSQIRDLTRKNITLGKGNLASDPLKKAKDRLVFPYDGVFWPDEVLNLKAQAQSLCLEKAAL
jgi:tetratricopeptide (TPR) repeat protein